MASARAGKEGPLAARRAGLAKTLKSFDQGGVVKSGGPGHWEINGADSKFIPE